MNDKGLITTSTDQVFQNPDEREVLLRAVDILSMDVLRLKSENESLKLSLESYNKRKPATSKKIGRRSENVWTKAFNYYQREGFINTIKKIISKLTGRLI